MTKLTFAKTGMTGRGVRRVDGRESHPRLPKNLKDLVVVQLSIRAFRAFLSFSQKPYPPTRLPVSEAGEHTAPANFGDR